MDDVLLDWIRDLDESVSLAATIAAALVVVGAALLMGREPRQGEFVFSAIVNATEEALHTEFRRCGSLQPLIRVLRLDVILAVGLGAFLVFIAGRSGLDGPSSGSNLETALGFGLWAGVGFAVADITEDVLMLSVINRFQKQMRLKKPPTVSWVLANLAAVVGMAKLALMLYVGGVVACVAIAEHEWVWKILGGLFALIVAGTAFANFRSAHRRWKVTPAVG